MPEPRTGYWRYDGRCEMTPEDHISGEACQPLLPHSHRKGPTIKWARFIEAEVAAPRAATEPAAALTVERLERWKLEADDGDDARFVDGWNTALDTVLAALASPDKGEPRP